MTTLRPEVTRERDRVATAPEELEPQRRGPQTGSAVIKEFSHCQDGHQAGRYPQSRQHLLLAEPQRSQRLRKPGDVAGWAGLPGH